MYDDLKINLPKRMMEFKDFEFNEFGNSKNRFIDIVLFATTAVFVEMQNDHEFDDLVKQIFFRVSVTV